jgi:hypothetical protein
VSGDRLSTFADNQERERAAKQDHSGASDEQAGGGEQTSSSILGEFD